MTDSDYLWNRSMVTHMQKLQVTQRVMKRVKLEVSLRDRNQNEDICKRTDIEG